MAHAVQEPPVLEAVKTRDRRVRHQARPPRPAAFASPLLEERPAPRGLYITSLVVHLMALVTLVVYRMLVPAGVVVADEPVIVQFLQPAVPEPEPFDLPVEETIELPKIAPAPVAPEPEPIEEAIPIPAPPDPEPIEEPPPATEPEEPAKPEPPKPRPEVRTNVFANDAASRSERPAPASDVRTGLFGAPEGTGRGVGSGPAVLAAPRTGAFDTVASMRPGGAGTRDGARGVSAAGFGGAPSSGTASTRRASDRASVKQGAFESAAPVPAASKPERPPAPTVEQVVEIVSKPTPLYTDEARALRLEGEVVLEVLFGAGGRLSVLRIVKGLGHGLDEAAIRAAEGIRFKPARRAGQAIDHVATLRVVFQLA